MTRLAQHGKSIGGPVAGVERVSSWGYGVEESQSKANKPRLCVYIYILFYIYNYCMYIYIIVMNYVLDMFANRSLAH